jgi:hypothetical protein
VPQIMTMEGRFVRAAYNNEGYVILGYRLANMSVGQPWLLLEVGVTVRDKVPSYSLTPAAISLETPDGKTIPLPSNQEFRAAQLVGLQKQADMIRDSINYFPPGATRACRIGFFADVDDRASPTIASSSAPIAAASAGSTFRSRAESSTDSTG